MNIDKLINFKEGSRRIMIWSLSSCLCTLVLGMRFCESLWPFALLCNYERHFLSFGWIFCACFQTRPLVKHTQPMTTSLSFTSMNSTSLCWERSKQCLTPDSCPPVQRTWVAVSALARMIAPPPCGKRGHQEIMRYFFALSNFALGLYGKHFLGLIQIKAK